MVLLGLPARAEDSTAAAARAGMPLFPEQLVVDRVFGRFGVGAGELTAPQGVAVDPRGRILVADTGNHRIVRFDSSGTYLDQFGGFGSSGNRFDRPTDVCVNGTLSIWVLDRGNARVVKFDLEGRPLGVVVDLRSDALRDRLGTVEPGGFAADAGGQIVLTDTAADRLLEFDPLGAVLVVRGEFGVQEGRFADPSGVAIAGGAVWIADAGNRRVQLFDASGVFRRSHPIWPTMKASRGLALAVGPRGEYAVADPATGTLVLYDEGEPLALWTPKDGKDVWAAGVAFDAAGRLLVADARHHRVVRLARRLPRFNPLG